ncbi:MAG: AAA family ATPase, partial [Thiomargarita sp.]|nr:AAA family ATPase [Thiomargarita sp.]
LPLIIMKFQFNKLGPIDAAEIELGDLTILCGKNNTGKTYALRAINGFLNMWHNEIDFKISEDNIQSLLVNGVLKLDLSLLEKDIVAIVDVLSQKYTDSRALLHKYQPNYEQALHVSLGTHSKNVLQIIKDKDSCILNISLLAENKNVIPHVSIIKHFINKGIGQALLAHYFANPFMINSERRSEFADEIITVHSKQTSALIKEHPALLTRLKDIVGGEYKVENNQIVFYYQKNQHIPLHLASATVNSQLELNFYLKCIAKKGDILLIDEPEKDLHPANQRKMARLFVQLIQAGIKIFIITHSDYLIKELNHLIILSHQFDDRKAIMTKYDYRESEVLEQRQVKTYNAEKHTLVNAKIDDMGIDVISFDKEIDEMNHLYNEITVNLPCAYVD